jgi:NhaP-type Na+/H+ or K+/H+ antiporter
MASIYYHQRTFYSNFSHFVQIILLLTRAFAVFPIINLSNWANPSTKVPFFHQIFLWLSGLRGAIAFSLALQVSSDQQPTILAMTWSVIVFSVIGQGILAPWLVRRMSLNSPTEEHHELEPNTMTHWSLDQKMTRILCHPVVIPSSTET